MSEQIIAHDPNSKEVNSADPKARLAIGLLGLGLVVSGCSQVLNLLHDCAVENIIWDMNSLGTQSVVDCVKGTQAWLPYILKHLVK